MRAPTAFLIMFPLVLIAGAFVAVATHGARADDQYVDGLWWDEGMVQFVRQRIAQTYVDPVDRERASKLFYKAMEAYLHELDEYCDFISPDEHRRWMDDMKGQYGGVGIQVREQDDGLEVVGVLPGQPAALAGIRVGDTIVAADGRPIGKAATERDLTQLLKGPPNSTVRLTLVGGPRPEKGPAVGPRREVVAKRALVRPPSVFSRRIGKDGQFGLLRITEFNDATADAFGLAVNSLMAAGVKGMVLDLRDNPGGVLNAACLVVDRFLSRGLIVRMESRIQGANEKREASDQPGDVPNTVPVAVVVNGSSASASEVVAGALQDHRRALIVGERTYGKFLVQQITDVPNRDAAVEITYARYYTPSGRSYQRKAGEHGARGAVRAENGEPAGLLPDVVVPLDDKQRAAVRSAFEREERQAWGQAADKTDDAAPAPDPQLEKAMEILEGELILRKLRGR